MNDQTINAYLKAIWTLKEKNLQVSTLNISKFLCVKPSSVTEMLQKLSAEGYVKYSKYKEVNLSDKGTLFAQKAVRKQRLVELFLTKTLGLTSQDVAAQSQSFSLSDHADQQLCIFLSGPNEDLSHGKIPHCTKKITCSQCLKEHQSTHSSSV